MGVEKAVVIVSGGMDSVTLLWNLVKSGKYDVSALSFDYRQRHARELQCAAYNCKKLGTPHKIINLKQIGKHLLQGSALTSPDVAVPEGHYEAENMKQTVVPNRNMIMLSLAIGYAVSTKARTVFYGAHAGDHAIYPDCRAEFVEAMKKAAALCDWEPVTIEAPFQNMDKGDIVKNGLALGVKYAKTWTCYKGGKLACGRCGSCSERVLAFHKAGVADPVKYEMGWDAALAGALEMLKWPKKDA